jgi:lipoprotein NlpD
MLNRFRLLFLASLPIYLLIACSVQANIAPVINAWHDPGAIKSRYRVQKNDTIYSIAFAFDLDYREIARTNHLKPPYRLKPDQTLSLVVSQAVEVSNTNNNEPEVTLYAAKEMKGESAFQEIEIKQRQSVVHEKPSDIWLSPPPNITKPKTTTAEINLPEFIYQSKIPSGQNRSQSSDLRLDPLPNKCLIPQIPQDKPVAQIKAAHWLWPAKGKLLKEFSFHSEAGSKGIDIAGQSDDLIRAAAAGKVVYSGSGLRGYGNLIIIKHSDNYLSAYAYNKKLLVKEGDVVKMGAEIARMGQNEQGQVLLHFEIRKNGKPVNPLLYL